MTPKNRIIPIFVPHLGCPNDCVFCNQRKISGSLFPASAAQVTEALTRAKGISEHGELAFYGGSFTAIPLLEQGRLLAAAQPFRADGFLQSIRVSTRPDAVTAEKLEFLRSFGVETVELGAQSMDERVLRCAGRGHTAAATRTASALVRQSGLRLILQMMTGLPGSSPESDLRTAQELIALQPDGVRIYPTVILRDTALEALWKRGEYRAHTVMDAVVTNTPIVRAFQAAGIPILRLGLNPTETLSGGEAVAGAYHPALGELIYSRIFLEKAREAIRALGRLPREIELLTAPCDVSKMTGQKRANLLALQMEFGLRAVRVKTGAFLPGTVAIREVL